jgi:hypothetical protein
MKTIQNRGQRDGSVPRRQVIAQFASVVVYMGVNRMGNKVVGERAPMTIRKQVWKLYIAAIVKMAPFKEKIWYKETPCIISMR